MPYELIVDAILAILMGAVIFSAFILNGRIATLRRGQEEMRALVEQLDTVTRKAQNSIEELKATGAETQQQFSEQINKARGLADELSLITQAGDNLATRLEGQLTNKAEKAKKTKKQPTAKDNLADLDKNVPDQLDEEQEKVLEALKLAR